MSNLGKGIYDDQGKVSASLIPNVTGLDIGSVEAPFRNLYVTNAFGAIDLANNVYLKARNAANSAYLDLLKADATDNTVINALTAKRILFDINHLVTWSVEADGSLLGDATNGKGIKIAHLGSTLTLVAGANAKAGTFVANGATPVTVATTAFIAGSAVLISLKTVGGTVGAQPHLATATPATGFTVVATALDTSTYNWVIIDQA